MGYSVSVDSGGSKTIAILYDADYRIVSQVRTGSLRDNCTSPELIAKHLDEMVSGLFDGLEPGRVKALDCVCGSLGSGETLKVISERVPVLGESFGGEGSLGMAAVGRTEGIVALAGTGASMILESEKYGHRAFGGYGAVVFDEGSGYHIGRMGFAAAIRYHEGRGEPTQLLERIIRYLGGDTLPKGVFGTLYNPDGPMSPVGWVASVCRVVAEAAVDGDRVAQEIMRTAGNCLGTQMNALIRRHGIDESLPIALSGSVYKGSRIVYDEFCRVVREENPVREILIPWVEPVVGAILLDYLRHHGSIDERMKQFFLEEYRDYRYHLGK
ncbi:MAG: hypothetical protein IKM07_02890 [Clostridia bacterium]|nr:hypothetical protein [Clostridia bacterium]